MKMDNRPPSCPTRCLHPDPASNPQRRRTRRSRRYSSFSPPFLAQLLFSRFMRRLGGHALSVGSQRRIHTQFSTLLLKPLLLPFRGS